MATLFVPSVAPRAAAPAPRPPAAHVAAGPSPAILAALHDPAINLVVWERTLADDLRAALAAVDLGRVQDVRLALPVCGLQAGLASTLSPALAAAGWHAPALAADVADLARRFAGVMACTAVEIRLDVVRGDACRKFHADYVPARLVTTYLGPGTDWLPDDARDETPVRGLAAGAVGLFKGRTWPTEQPIIHRSPPIAGTGRVRVVLVINPADDGNHTGTGC